MGVLSPGLTPAVESVRSRRWASSTPRISVVVTTFGRSGYLPALMATLEQLDPVPGGHEVVLVDNGSDDDTWPVLADLVRRWRGPATAIRLPSNRGPGGGRNAGVAVARGELVAFTDDDCYPTRGWLRAVDAAFADPAVGVAQGPVRPEPGEAERMGPWDHTIAVGGPTPFFETSNVAYRAGAFEAVGGFDEADPLTARHGGGRAFGEDAVLGARVLASGHRRGWLGDAGLVHHRCVPAGYLDQLRSHGAVAGFAGLARRSAVVREAMFLRVFLNRDTARFDLAAAGLVLALGRRRFWPAMAALPWARRRWPQARGRAGNRRLALVRLVQQLVVESWAMVSFVRGSIQHRKVCI